MKNIQNLKNKSNTQNKVVKASPKVHSIEGFVVTRSKQQFSEEQLTLLIKGLAYAITAKPDVVQAIIDVETAITHTMSAQLQETARNITEEVLGVNRGQVKRGNNQEVKILRELKEKEVYYVKADNGNAVVILDKEAYDNKMNEKITTGPYRQLRVDQLPGMVRHVEKTIKECKANIRDNTSRLKVSNPVLPRIKGLLKDRLVRIPKWPPQWPTLTPTHDFKRTNLFVNKTSAPDLFILDLLRVSKNRIIKCTVV